MGAVYFDVDKFLSKAFRLQHQVVKIACLATIRPYKEQSCLSGPSNTGLCIQALLFRVRIFMHDSSDGHFRANSLRHARIVEGHFRRK